MDNAPLGKPSREDLPALVRLAGIQLSEDNLATVGPLVERFYETVLRLRELDLAGVEPAFVFRAGKE